MPEKSEDRDSDRNSDREHESNCTRASDQQNTSLTTFGFGFLGLS
jgi:hypothetical protein